MKKILSMLLVFAMMFGLLACGASKPAQTQAPTEAPATTAVPTEAAAEVPTQAGLVVDTCILKEADDKMLNTYTVIAVNPEAPFVDADGNSVADVAVNTAGADALIKWFLTQETLDLPQTMAFKSTVSICSTSRTVPLFIQVRLRPLPKRQRSSAFPPPLL